MNRAEKRKAIKEVKKLNPSQFKREMDDMHSLAYRLAEKHFAEAMGIVLQPKQAAAVIAKAKQIREDWDGIREITLQTTAKEA